jgi:hypothetical protein
MEQTLEQRQQEMERDFNDRQRQLQHDFEQWRGNLTQQLSQPEAPPLQLELPSLDGEENLEKTIMLPMVDGVLERTRWLVKDEEEAKRLLIRRRELDFFSQHLRRTRDRLVLNQHQPGGQHLNNGNSERYMETKESLGTCDLAETGDLLKQQQEALARAEAVMQEQQVALASMLAEWRQLQSPASPEPDPDVEKVLRENEELRQLLQERLYSEPAEPAAAPMLHQEVDTLRTENELLQKLLDEKDTELRQIRQQNPSTVDEMPAVEDVDSYEAELVQFRRQLEAERQQLNREIAQIRTRNQEMEEATREIEMELSRERAEIARERIRLDRMREEIQTDLERLRRDGSMMERLAPVQKLREEIAENRQKPPATTPSPSGKSDPNFVNNLRNLRTR